MVKLDEGATLSDGVVVVVTADTVTGVPWLELPLTAPVVRVTVLYGV